MPCPPCQKQGNLRCAFSDYGFSANNDQCRTLLALWRGCADMHQRASDMVPVQCHEVVTAQKDNKRLSYTRMYQLACVGIRAGMADAGWFLLLTGQLTAGQTEPVNIKVYLLSTEGGIEYPPLEYCNAVLGYMAKITKQLDTENVPKE